VVGVAEWLLVEDGDRRYRVGIAKDGTGTWVFVDGVVARLDEDAPAKSRRAKSGKSEVMSPMPATVVSVNAQPGQTVSEGETVIVLEAMKMELPIKAPRGGVVKAIHCAKGDLVQPGVTLLEIE
jgi:3-methylcrotonyl-CoA carboxylase alpha subunit